MAYRQCNKRAFEEDTGDALHAIQSHSMKQDIVLATFLTNVHGTETTSIWVAQHLWSIHIGDALPNLSRTLNLRHSWTRSLILRFKSNHWERLVFFSYFIHHNFLQRTPLRKRGAHHVLEQVKDSFPEHRGRHLGTEYRAPHISGESCMLSVSPKC